jgi:hypothetical protein
MKHILILLCFFALGCETGADGKKHLSKKAIAALDHLGEDVLDIGENALTGALTGVTTNLVTQGVSGEKFDSSQLSTAAALGAFNGAAKGLRGLEGRRTAPSAEEITTAIAQGTGSPEVSRVLAPGVAGAITAAVAKGAPVNQAIEVAAVHLDEQGVR